MKKRITAVVVLLAFVLAGVALVSYNREKTDHEQDITLAVSVQPLNAPVYAAKDKGFFEEEGLHVSLQPYSAGKDALNATLSGKAQFCTVSDTPLTFAGLKGENVYVVATIGNSNDHVKIVARKDRGIAGPLDLKGKNIGVRPGTSSEYFLYSYLTFNGMRMENVHMIGMQIDEMEDALADGKIDAAVAWEPYLTSQQKRLGADAVVLENAYVYRLDWNIAGRQDFIGKNQETVAKLLRAIIKATDYIAENPDDAEKIVARNIGRKSVTLTKNTYDVHLQQSLIVNLESQARWAIESGLTDQRQVPNYLPMIYAEGLRAVRPEAVTVISE